MAHLSRLELADAFGVTLYTINRWRTLGLPACANGGGSMKFDLAECQTWAHDRGLGLRDRIDSHVHQRASVKPPPPTREELEALGRLAQINQRWLPLLAERLGEADIQTFGDTELDEAIIEKLTGWEKQP